MCTYNHATDYEPSSEYECYEARNVRQTLGCIADLVIEELIPMLYGKEEIDVAYLDDTIGQICDRLELKSPETLPRVRRTRSEIFELAAHNLRGEKYV